MLPRAFSQISKFQGQCPGRCMAGKKVKDKFMGARTRKPARQPSAYFPANSQLYRPSQPRSRTAFASIRWLATHHARRTCDYLTRARSFLPAAYYGQAQRQGIIDAASVSGFSLSSYRQGANPEHQLLIPATCLLDASVSCFVRCAISPPDLRSLKPGLAYLLLAICSPRQDVCNYSACNSTI